ncbi:MAG TPA: sigma-70 family RNA polymerase sigma factor, partial [Gemmataceae bacterium]
MNDQHLGAAVRAACRRLAPEDVGKRSDAELLQRFLDRRDEGAFAGLMERHGPMVLGVCRRLLPSHHDAEDAFQATFLVLSQRAASVRRRPSLAAWLHGVARRTALCARRAALRRRRHEGQATSPAPSSPAAELTWREVCEVLEGEIARLPEKYREVFLLCCREGRSRAEAAGLLGLKEGTIASRLDTARKRLRDRLARRGISLGTALSATALTPDVPAGTLPVMAAKGTAAAALAKEVTRAMALGKIKYAAAVLAAGLIAAGAGGLALSGPGPAPPPPPGTSDPEDRNVAKTNSAAQPEAGAEGAGLPEHARARLGTVRFRQEGRVRVVAFGPGGKTLLSGADSTINPLRLRDEDRGLILWDALTGRPIRGFRPPEVPERPGRFLSAAYSRDGKFVAGAFGPPGVFVWDAATGNLVRDFPPGKLDQAMAFSPDGKMLYVASREPSVRRFDVAAGRELEPVPGQSRSLVPAFSPDGKLFAAAGSDDKGTFLTLYDTAGRELWSVRAHRSTVRDLTFTPDGKALLTGSSDGTACLWSAADGKRLLELRHPEKSWAYAVAVTPDGAELITGCTDGVIRVWDAKTGRELRRIEGSRVAVRSLDVSPDGTVLASCSGSAILLWDLRTGSPVFPIDGHLDRPEAVAFSPVAPLVATAGWDRTVLLWDAATGKELRRLTGHGQGVSALAFSPDGKLLASGGNNDDASIRVWEVATGRELARYKG